MILTLTNIAAVGFGGAIGAVGRYLFQVGALLVWPAFPLGTSLANIVGCFLIGVVYGWQVNSGLNSELRLFLFTGFLGGFTTFSAFSLELNLLVQDRRWVAAALMWALHAGGAVLLTGIGCYFGGKLLVR